MKELLKKMHVATAILALGLALGGLWAQSAQAQVKLTVHIGPYNTGQASLQGIGAGSCIINAGGVSITQTVSDATHYFPANTDIALISLPAAVGGLDSLVYKWYEDFNDDGVPEMTPLFVSSVNFTLTSATTVWLLYSKEFFSYDNAGDIDRDRLPDQWEIIQFGDSLYGGPAENANPPYGRNDNQDNDFIPSAGTNPPMLALAAANVLSYSAQSGDAGYPLLRERLLTPGQAYYLADSLGYATGIKFDNFLECRGLDACYRTNVPPGGPVYSSPFGDDPQTDPLQADTDNDGMTDGWEYYFWYWRSVESFAAGVTNSAGLTWVGITPVEAADADNDTDGDKLSDFTEFKNGADPTCADTDGDGMDDYWEINNISTPGAAASNALDYLNWSLNPDGDYYAVASNLFVLADGMRGTAFTNNVCYSGAASNPAVVWVNIYTVTGGNVFDLYRDTIVKASVALTNRQAGSIYAGTVYYGTNNGMTDFRQGYPVWVDMNGNAAYDAGVDIAIINPPIKHVAVYTMPPPEPFPGVTSFDPRTAWNRTNSTAAHPNTAAYNNYQEYLGGDYLGRVSWDAGGRTIAVNDSAFVMNAAHFTNPNSADSDGDTMEDGWELYVGLNPNDLSDAGLDPDGDTLVNLDEWANIYRTYANAAATVGPTDPGVAIAPAPNDPHPKDTDWDGLGDALEKTGSNPTAFDTDNDGMPDGWEVYAGANVTNADNLVDLDGDGLSNFQEYWTGSVPEWQNCDAAWAGAPGIGVCFMTRRIMPWDNISAAPDKRFFIPPDFLTDGSFMYYNGISTDVAWLRTNYPAIESITGKYEENYLQYHTTLANNPDSDGDGMDDFWEVYHGLNPCKGFFDMMMPGPSAPGGLRIPSYRDDVDYVDADPLTLGFQFGIRPELGAGVFHNLAQMVAYCAGTNRYSAIAGMIGPFNFGLQQMDPDGDGLPNLEEYSYSPNRALYHTDPTPIWRTDSQDTSSFVSQNYTWDYFPVAGLIHSYDPFEYEQVEGFDTDNDGVGDYAEINAAAGELGNNPLDERNPIRNRALYLNGAGDFARTPVAWTTLSETFLTRFCVEAWVKPDNPARQGEQVILEKASLYNSPYNPTVPMVGANFCLGITNGLPYVLYNGRGSLRAYQAVAQVRHRLAPGVWAHLAGVYNGTLLTLYVNGESSVTLGTTELPATGVDAAFSTAESNIFYKGHGHSIMIGAHDLTAGYDLPTGIVAANNFGGCIDEARIWNGARSQGDILATKDRRILRSEMKNSSLAHYYSFDDVPDPSRRNSAGVLYEPVAPFGLTNLDATMSFHPPMNWWAAYPQRSTVYSGLNGSYNYLVSAADHAAHMSLTPPRDDRYHFSSNFIGTNALADYNNFSNPYHVPSMGGGEIIEDLYLFLGARGVATNSWLAGLDPNNPDATDSDGDGLPDWWEQKYGLDPLDPNGVNGAWGDPDHDGLNNLAEYRSGADPHNTDTFGTGVGDYNSPRGVYSRTYGEMYTDGDWMPDDWEVQYGLDPQKYDANLDLDGDGWSNYAEYQAGTDPNNKYSYPQPLVFGVANYYGDKAGMLRFYAYETETMDGAPQITKIGTDSLISEVVGQANGTFIFAGSLPIAPIDATTVVRISATLTNGMFVTFTFTGPGLLTYSGAGTDYAANLDYITGRFTLRWASLEVPAANANVSVDYSFVNRNAAAFSLSGFKEGDFYLLALMDANNNTTFNAGEPMGIMEDQAVNLSYSSISGIRVLITDERPGFGRFAWNPSATVTTAYPVVVTRLSQSGAVTILQRSMDYPRAYFHEWDFQLAGIEGLIAGSYQWWVGAQHGTFAVNWPASLVKPVLVYPRGDTLYYDLNQFAWTMDFNCPMVHLQIARQASDGKLSFVADKYIRTPWMDDKGIFRKWMDDYASDWGNGVYFWRVAGWNPQGESAWSDAQTFTVNLSAANSRWIAGDIYYFGKAPAGNIVVEAYENRGFGGRPAARLQLTPSVTPNWIKCHYVLQGLQQGSYYVRAFIDTTPTGSQIRTGKLDFWKSWGFYRDPNNFYQAGLVNLADLQFKNGANAIINDRDTDNDKLPDAWEMAYFGNLDQTGDMDYDGDGESNLEEYIRDGVNLNPSSWDTDGDGLSDKFELTYSGVVSGLGAGAQAAGRTLNPTAWDTDGDGYSDGAELMRYRTDPLDPNSYPSYLPACYNNPWSSRGDFDGDGRTDIGVYDYNSGMWYLATMAGQSYALPFGSTHARPLVGDFTGDGHSDFAFYDPTTGIWHIFDAQSGQSADLKFGGASMLPVSADYTGDGRADLAVYDTGNGMWYIYDVWSGQVYPVPFGTSRMIPVPGDYNGDGAADLAVYEPATGNWMIACYHKYYHTWQTFSGTFGGPTWTPVAGDYDGDGRNDACLFERSTGRWQLLTIAGQFQQGTFGWAGCLPVSGDYDGDGRSDPALYDTNTGMWHILCMSGKYYEGRFGWPGAIPVAEGR